MSKQEITPKYGGRTQTLTENTARVSALVSMAAEDMQRANTGEKVPLGDLERVSAVSLDYLRECSENGTLPTVRGCAARLGVSRIALYEYAKAHPNGGFSKWLEDYSDFCGEICAAAALEGTISAVPAIFVLKSRFQWREAPAQLELGRIDPMANDGRDADELAAEIATKYGELPSD